MTPFGLGVELGPFVLLWLRLWPACALLPSAALRRPVLLGPVLLAALGSACLAPLLATGDPVPLSGLVALRELVLGLCFALVVAAPLIALAWFGHALDRSFWAAPTVGSGPLSRLYGAFGLALFFALGGHRVVLSAFMRLLRAAPLGGVEPGQLSIAVPVVVSALAQALTWTLLWAAPFVIGLLLFELLSGLIARFIQRASLLSTASPLRVLWALTVVVLGGAFVADVFPEAIARVATSTATLVGP